MAVAAEPSPEPPAEPQPDPQAEAVAVVAAQPAPEAESEPTERVAPIEATPEAPLVETGIEGVQSLEEEVIEEEGEAEAIEAEVNEGGPENPSDASATVRGPAPERKFSHQQGRRLRRRGRDQRGERGPAQAAAGQTGVGQAGPAGPAASPAG